jgi:hypothetical protein
VNLHRRENLKSRRCLRGLHSSMPFVVLMVWREPIVVDFCFFLTNISGFYSGSRTWLFSVRAVPHDENLAIPQLLWMQENEAMTRTDNKQQRINLSIRTFSHLRQWRRLSWFHDQN